MNTQPNGQMPSEIRPTRFRRHTGSNCCPTAAHISTHGQRAKRAGRREAGQNTSSPHPQCRREAPARNRAPPPPQPCFSRRPPPDARPESRRQTLRRQPSDGICGKPCRLKPATSRVLLYNAEICACTPRFHPFPRTRAAGRFENPSGGGACRFSHTRAAVPPPARRFRRHRIFPDAV